MSQASDNQRFVTALQGALKTHGHYTGTVDGWAGSLTYQALHALVPSLSTSRTPPPASQASSSSHSARLHAHAQKDLGIREKSGPQSHARISKAFELCPLWLTRDDSVTSWCGIIMGLWTDELSLPRPEEHWKAIAWLEIGESIPITSALPGDVVILSRTGGNHVGLFHAADANTITLLGGNQSDSVNLSRFSHSLLRGIRRFTP